MSRKLIIEMPEEIASDLDISEATGLVLTALEPLLAKKVKEQLQTKINVTMEG